MKTFEEFRASAESRGWLLHQSMTADRWQRAEQAEAEPLTNKNGKWLDDSDSLNKWISDRCFIAPGKLGQIGGEIVTLPKMNPMGVVMLPSPRRP